MSRLPPARPRRPGAGDLRRVRPAAALLARPVRPVSRRRGVTGAGRWKRQERQIAAALGGVRLPNTGAGQCDVRAPGWAVQVKTRATLPGWLWAAVDQAERDAGPDEAPAVVLSEVTAGR